VKELLEGDSNKKYFQLIVKGIDIVLLAVRQLLNNPPPSEALPSAAEQWRHDVNQPVVATINMPHRERRLQPSAQQSHIPSAVCVPSVAQAPPVLPNAHPPAQHHAPMVSYTTTYLREEIRCDGEDSCTAIECHSERRRDIESRNLKKDFDLHAPVRGGLVAHAPLPLNSSGIFWGGVHGTCPTLAYGGLAAQVPAPPTREVRWDGQPRQVPVDLLHLHPRCRQE
jgi:hypothetical protein